MDYAQKDGYRCAVLNHLGALPNIELTSPRMFTYGEILSEQNITGLYQLSKVFNFNSIPVNFWEETI